MAAGPCIAIDAMGGDTGPATMIAGAARARRKDSSLQFQFFGDERQLLRLLRDAGIERILTSPYDRCVQTVEPLAALTGAKIEVYEDLAEESDIDAAYVRVDSLVGSNAVVCSHGDVIPALINRMMWAGLSLSSRFYCSKGSIWEVEVDNGKFTTAHYIPA